MTKSIATIFKFAFIFLLSSAALVISCKKEKSETPPEKTKKELLAASWKVSDIQDATGTSLITLPVPQIQCLKDNIFTFVADDTYTIDEGTVVCDPSTAGSGTWALMENDTQIKFTPTSGDDPITLNLLDVNATTLKCSYLISDGPLPGTYVVILKKQ